MLRQPVRLTAGAFAAAALLLSACGTSSGPPSNGEAKKSGQQVIKDSAAALGKVTAVHFAGTQTDPATKKQSSVDLQLQSDGTSGLVTFAGTPVHIVSTGGVSYLKAPAAFYINEKAASAVAAQYADRWVKLPKGSTFATFNLAAIAKAAAQPSSDSPVQKKVTTGTLDGQKVVIVSQADGSQLMVAATGEPLPLKTVNSPTSKEGAGSTTFTGYGKHVTIAAPAGAVAGS